MRILYLLVILMFLTACGGGVTGSTTLETPSEAEESLQEPAYSVPNLESDGNTNFNVEVDLPDSYQTVEAGEELWFTTRVLNLANKERMDITLTYQILELLSREVKYSKSETVAIETQASFVAQLKVPSTLKTGIYLLKVHLKGPTGNAITETTFNVVKEETPQQIIIKLSLFDILVDIPKEYQIVQAGEELLASVKAINVGSAGRIDVFMEYWITNEDGKTILSEAETVAIETQNNFIKRFHIPITISEGTYLLHARLSYPGLEFKPEFSASFIVGEEPVRKSFLGYGISSYGILSMIAVFMLFFLYLEFGSMPLGVQHFMIKRKVYNIVQKRKKN